MNKKIKIIILVIMMVMVVVGLTGCEGGTSTHENEGEIVYVKDKWIKRVDDRDLYMIGTENEVFKIEDNWIKWNSADLYNSIEIGKRYRITTTGYRSTWSSSFRNINTVEEIIEE